MASYYWAKFKNENGLLIRLDTRVYLNEIELPKLDDPCLGAIIGKNPGSARPTDSSAAKSDFVSIDLSGDRLLPNVRSILSKAYEGNQLNSYIQVLNLFPICDKELKTGIKQLEKSGLKPNDFLPKTTNYEWLWYSWGGSHPLLDELKKPYRNLKSKHKFYFDNDSKQVVDKCPEMDSKARHLQGMPHIQIVEHLKKLIP